MIALIKYWRLFALGAVLISLGVSHLVAYNKGVQTERNRNVTKVIAIEEKQNEISNNRPDTVQLIERLYRGKF